MEEKWQKDPADAHFRFLIHFGTFVLFISEPSWAVFQVDARRQVELLQRAAAVSQLCMELGTSNVFSAGRGCWG